MNINRKIIFMAIILGALTTFMAYHSINPVNNSKQIEVWVAKTDIPANTEIDSTMVETKQVDKGSIIENAITKGNSVIGKHLQVPVIAGEQLVLSTLAAEDKSKFSYQIPKAKVAVTIEVDGVAGVDYLIKSGDFVDAFVFLQQEKYDDKSSTVIFPNITKLVAQKVLVLSVGKEENSKSSNNSSKADQDLKKKVTLAISPVEAEKLILADNIGKLRLTLRSPDNSQLTDTEGSIRWDLISEKGKKILSK